MTKLPNYPIYVPSKGRSDCCLTAQFLRDEGIPFWLVVEPQEREAYTRQFGKDSVLVLPWDNPGSVIPARNWIKDHATASGAERHWQIDDNCRGMYWAHEGRRMPCDAGPALALMEYFTDRYENVAVSGPNYTMFFMRDTGILIPAFAENNHVYSCSLILNSTPHRWRGRYNEDTDYCLQVLADGWCTILVYAFMIAKQRTMTMKGGNAAELYQGDGRLKMARSLERMWPGVVKTTRRWGRPQHYVTWSKFNTPLKLKPNVSKAAKGPGFGMVLKRTAPKQGD